MTSAKIYQLILPAFGAAIMAALAQLSLPLGTVPVTLQTFAVGVIALIFRPKEATAAALLYLLLGAIGLPVFSGGSGGFQVFLSPNAGYLLAYPFFACLTAYLTRSDKTFWKSFLAFCLGDTIVFVFGIAGLYFLGNVDWWAAFSIGVLPFLIPDIIKGVSAALIAASIRKALKNESYFN